MPGNWSGTKPDLECDIKKLPFPDNYADNITAIHVFEHFHRLEVEDILAEWRRVLKPGGSLVLEMPCLEKICHRVLNPEWTDEKSFAKWLQFTLIGLYGDVNESKGHPEMLHQWCYSTAEMRSLLEDKFSRVRFREPEWHYKQRDFRVEAFK